MKNWIKLIKSSDYKYKEEIYNYLVSDLEYTDEEAHKIIDDGDFIYVDGEDERDLGYNFVHEVLGSLDEVTDSDKERFFDFGKFGMLYIDSSTFTMNEDGEYVEDLKDEEEVIHTGAKTPEELGKWIYENYFDSLLENISEKDKSDCFNYERFGKYLLDECNFAQLENGFVQL